MKPWFLLALAALAGELCSAERTHYGLVDLQKEFFELNWENFSRGLKGRFSVKLSWIGWVVRTTAYRRPWVLSCFVHFPHVYPAKKCVFLHMGWDGGGRVGGAFAFTSTCTRT